MQRDAGDRLVPRPRGGEKSARAAGSRALAVEADAHIARKTGLRLMRERRLTVVEIDGAACGRMIAVDADIGEPRRHVETRQRGAPAGAHRAPGAIGRLRHELIAQIAVSLLERLRDVVVEAGALEAYGIAQARTFGRDERLKGALTLD